MTEQTMTTPTYPAQAPAPRRDGGKSMIPTSWRGRTLRVEYTDSFGSRREASGMFLDWCPVGLTMNFGGARTLIAWDRLSLLELVED